MSPPPHLTVVLWVRRDAISAIRCIQPLVEAVPADMPAELLVLGVGLDKEAAAPLLELGGMVTVGLAPSEAVLGEELQDRIHSGRVLLVDGDIGAAPTPGSSDRLRTAVRDAIASREPVVGDDAVLGFDAELLRHPASALAVDQIALRGVLSLAARPRAIVLAAAPREPAPAPHRTESLPPAPLVTVIVYGALAPSVDALTRLRQRTRVPFHAVLAVTGSASRATSAATRHALVVDLPEPATDIDLLNAALPHSDSDIVVTVPAAASLSRFWLEGLIASLQEDPNTAVVWPIDVPPSDRPRQVAASLEEARGGGGSYERRAPAGPVAAFRGEAIRGRLLDIRFETAEAAFADLFAALRVVGWRGLQCQGVAVHQPPARARHAERPGLWPSGDDDSDRAALVHRHGWHSLPDGITACLIVRDEQANLPRVLASLADVVDDVVVCDTGSTDRTVELALALGARVIHTEWVDDFSAARNTVAEEARTAWIVMPDADEELECPSVDALHDVLRRCSADALVVPIRCWEGHRAVDGRELTYRYTKLYRSDRARHRGRVHEQPIGIDGGPVTMQSSDAVGFRHYGYLIDAAVGSDKLNRNIRIAEARHEDAPTPESAYELGRALFGANRWQDAKPHLTAAAAELPPASNLYSTCCRLLAQIAVAEDDLGAALEWGRTGLRHRPGDAQLTLLHVGLLAGRGRIGEALRTLDNWERAERDGLLQATTAADVQLPSMRGLLLAAQGEVRTGVALLERTARAWPGVFEQWPNFAKLLRTQHDDWARRIAVIAAPDPHLLLARLGQLPDDDRLLILRELRNLGVDVSAALAAVPQPRVAGDDAIAAAADARAAELTRPDLALTQWSALPDGPDSRAGRLRCLVALNRYREAMEIARRIDPQSVTVTDCMLAATLAVGNGDAQLAIAMLDAHTIPEALAADAELLRSACADLAPSG
ncbi:MAG TPA: glycosyltransferase [Mycobacteriales bacterium]|nr:glycosyltransferase [Mycobacteriales bacterium]